MAAPGCEHPRIRVAALILLEGKVLLVRHRKGNSVYHLLPGGGVEAGESLGQALAREVAEETGLAAHLERPLIVSDTIDPSGSRHLLNITCSVVVEGGTLRVVSDERVEGLDLVAPHELLELDLRPPFAKELVRAIDAGTQYHATYLGPLFTEEHT